MKLTLCSFVLRALFIQNLDIDYVKKTFIFPPVSSDTPREERVLPPWGVVHRPRCHPATQECQWLGDDQVNALIRVAQGQARDENTGHFGRVSSSWCQGQWLVSAWGRLIFTLSNIFSDYRDRYCRAQSWRGLGITWSVMDPEFQGEVGAMANRNAIITVTCFMRFSLILSWTDVSWKSLLNYKELKVDQKRNLTQNLTDVQLHCWVHCLLCVQLYFTSTNIFYSYLTNCFVFL